MKVHFIDATLGDWTQLYIDDELKYEGHSIPRWALLENLGIEYTEEEIAQELLCYRLKPESY